MEKTVCKTSFWSLLKGHLNNLDPEAFVSQLSETKQYILMDVRSPEEFEQGSFPGACNINYSSPDLWEQLEVIDKEKAIFVFCRSGRRSLRVCTLLKNGGFNNERIFNLDGGLNTFLKYFDFDFKRVEKEQLI